MFFESASESAVCTLDSFHPTFVQTDFLMEQLDWTFDKTPPFCFRGSKKLEEIWGSSSLNLGGIL
ncbi:MAG: hypothetical protein D6732_24835, partial [Methanobacteriota archaeon]